MAVLTAFTLLTLDLGPTAQGGGGPFDAVRRGADTVLGPAQRAVGGVARSVGSALGGLPNLGRFQDENRELRREVERLRTELARTEDLRRQKAEWDALLRLRDFGTYTTVPAHVTALGSSLGFEHTAQLDVGSRDGVREGMTVVTGAGLVGRTTRVGPFTSTVLLVVDPLFSVGSRLQRDATFGVARGQGSGRPLSYLLADQGTRINVGDVLVTTGSETFVRGVPVGRVTEVQSDANSLTRTAEVEPFVDVSRLDLVAVVTEPPRGTPRLPAPPSPVPTPSPSPAARPSASPAPSASAGPSPS